MESSDKYKIGGMISPMNHKSAIKFSYRIASSSGKRVKNVHIYHKATTGISPSNNFSPSKNPKHISFKKKFKPSTPLSSTYRSSFLNKTLNLSFNEDSHQPYSPPVSSRRNNNYIPLSPSYNQEHSLSKLFLSFPNKLKTKVKLNKGSEFFSIKNG